MRCMPICAWGMPLCVGSRGPAHLVMANDLPGAPAHQRAEFLQHLLNVERGRGVRRHVGKSDGSRAIDEKDAAALDQAEEDLVEGEALVDGAVRIGRHGKRQPQALRVPTRLLDRPRPDHQNLHTQCPDLVIRTRQPAGVRPALQSGKLADEVQDDGPTSMVAKANETPLAALEGEAGGGHPQPDHLGWHPHSSRDAAVRHQAFPVETISCSVG